MDERRAERFLTRRGERLGSLGFQDDPARPAWTPDGGLIVWHYTRPERLPLILGTAGGLRARKRVLGSELTPEFEGLRSVEGFLDPKPRWLDDSPAFGGEGGRRWRAHVGSVLLRVELPPGFRGVWVADWAHTLECYAVQRGEPAPLGLGYDCSTGRQSVRAYAHSLVPVQQYHGGHLAPVVTVMRRGPGIAVPRACVRLAEIQPRSAENESPDPSP